MSGLAVGVDACSEGWVAVALMNASFAAARFLPSIGEVLTSWPDARAFGVDIPIGLTSSGPREADLAVRTFLRHRRSSLFPVPPRSVVEQSDYLDACAAAVALTGKKISKQTFALFPKILEVDAHRGDDRIHEVHPETSFAVLASRPLDARKSSWNGACERRRLLLSAGVDIPDDLGAAGEFNVDDVLDAAVAAWSATRIVRGISRTFPETALQRDASGRLIQIAA